jgi:lipoate-protein ligase A
LNAAGAAPAALHARLRATPWRLLETEPAPGAWNMGLDWSLLQRAAAEQVGPVLRFYGWDPPCVSLGRFQEPGDLPVRARALGFDAVRRPTGGMAVLHQHELTYSVVLPPSLVGGAGIRTSYELLSGAVGAGLRALLAGRPAPAPPLTAAAAQSARAVNCFACAAECDTLVAGWKVVGSAQVRHRGALLQHGSLLLDVEPESWRSLFGEPGRLIPLRRLLDAGVASATLRALAAEALIDGFAELAPGWDRSPLAAEEARAAAEAAPQFTLPGSPDP